MLRKQNPDLTIVGAFWVDNIKVATRIAKASKAGCGTEAEAITQIKRTALKIHLTRHFDVVLRVDSVVDHVGMTLKRASGSIAPSTTPACRQKHAGARP